MSDAELEARMLVTIRSRGRCELDLPTVCTKRATDWSHRIARGRGGKWTASDGLAACRPCHETITNTRGQRARFERWGFIVRTGANTEEVPVLLGCCRWVLLDNQGGLTDVEVPT
jgi:IS5 family transposase